MQIIPISNQFPEHFYQISAAVYKDLPFSPEEDRSHLDALLRFQTEKFDLFLLTDEVNIRVLGICPKNSDTAYFGFWECTGQYPTCEAAFGMLKGLLKSKGYRNVEGPVHFNTFHRYRLRLQTPSWNLFNREPVNPGFYPLFLEKMGFEILRTYESRLIKSEVVPAVYKSKHDLVESVRALPFEFIPLNRDTWIKRERDIFELINEIFGLNPGFQSISIDEFRLLYNADFADQLCPHTSVMLAERQTGNLIAISLCHPNYAPLNLKEKPRFQVHYPLLGHKTLLAKTQGVHPEYRLHGLMNYLGAYGMLSFRKYYDDIIFCLMRDDNPSLRFTDAYDHEKAFYATYRASL